MLNRWFHNGEDDELSELIKLPKGRWILCGFGRFGQAVYKEFINCGLEVQVIEPKPQAGNQPKGTIRGFGQKR